MRLDTLQRIVDEKRAELAEYETTLRIMTTLNGHATRKLKGMDAIAGHAVLAPEKPKRKGGFPPGYRHSAKTKARIRAARLAVIARKKDKQQPSVRPAATLDFTLPESLAKWRKRDGFDSLAAERVALAVVHHLRADKHPTDWPTMRAVIEQLGWEAKPGMAAMITRHNSGKSKTVNGAKHFQLSKLGEKRLAEAEKRLGAE